MTLDEFLDKVCQRTLPKNPMVRIRTLAKELAEGAASELWSIEIPLDRGRIRQKGVQEYLDKRWKDDYPSPQMIAVSGYSQNFGHYMSLSREAFELIDEAEPSTIFISYRRSESSPFALLVLKYLKEAGLEPFLDMALVPGEDWHAGLRERIQSRDYFILLLGETTLRIAAGHPGDRVGAGRRPRHPPHLAARIHFCNRRLACPARPDHTEIVEHAHHPRAGRESPRI